MITDSTCKSDIESILDTYGKDVYSFAMSKLRNTADAEDVYQNVFLKLFEKKPEFSKPYQLRSWLMRTTYNFSMDMLRKSGRCTELLENTVAYTDKPDDFVSIISSLDEKYRDVVYLYYAQDMKISEIARLLNITISGTKTRLARARKILGNELKEELQ